MRFLPKSVRVLLSENLSHFKIADHVHAEARRFAVLQAIAPIPILP